MAPFLPTSIEKGLGSHQLFFVRESFAYWRRGQDPMLPSGRSRPRYLSGHHGRSLHYVQFICSFEVARLATSRYHDRSAVVGRIVFIDSSFIFPIVLSFQVQRLMNSLTSQTSTLSSHAQVVHQPSAPNMHQSTPIANSVWASILPISLPKPAPLPPLSSVDPSVHTRQLMS
jgi:hypothetical protein